MRIRTLIPQTPKGIEQELEWGLSDGAVINNAEYWFKHLHNMEQEEQTELIENEIERTKKFIGIWEQELAKRGFTYLEKYRNTKVCGRPFKAYYYIWYKNHEGVWLCQICRRELAEHGNYCPKCGAEIKALTEAWKNASDKTRDYFMEMLEEQDDTN